MAAKVFLSYRRDASAGHAGRIKDRLDRELGHDLLFMDVDAIPLGMNFVKVLHEEIAKCDVLLAMIGPNWLDARDEDGNRRLDNPNDFVRVEIAAALQRDISVIPILLDGARIPKSDQLPKDLEELSLRNGLDVRHASFHPDMDRLIRGLKQQLGQANAPHASGLPPEDRGKMEEAEARQREKDESRSEETEAKQLTRPEGELDSAEPVWRTVRKLTGHEQTISCIACARDGNTLASGCSRIIFDPELWIWDIGNKAVRTKLTGHTASLYDLAFSPDGKILASGASDNTLRLWSVPDGKPLHTLRGGNSDCCFWSVAFSPDGATLAAGTNEPMVRLWRCADGKPLRILEEHKKWVTSLTFSPDGTFLASASFEMELRIWRVRDWESWSLGYVQSKADLDRKRNIAFSPDGALFAAGAQLWRVSDWKLTGTLEADEFEPAKVSSAVFSPDNKLIATATWERNSWPFQAYAVQLWRVADKTILWRLTCDYSRPPCLAWSPDGSLLISVGKSIYLYSRLHH